MKGLIIFTVIAMGSGCATGKSVSKALNKALEVAQGPCLQAVAQASAVCSEHPPVK